MSHHWDVHYDSQNDKYEVYYIVHLTTKNGLQTVMETDCFTCDVNGEVEKHEIYSEVLNEWRPCPLPDKEKKLYPIVFAKLRERLATAIRKYNETCIEEDVEVERV